MISMLDSFPEMARHNTQIFEHSLLINLNFIQVQIINTPISYILLQMICFVLLNWKTTWFLERKK